MTVTTKFSEQKVENHVALILGSIGGSIKDEYTILICIQSLFWNMVSIQSFNSYLMCSTYVLGIMLGTYTCPHRNQIKCDYVTFTFNMFTQMTKIRNMY